MDYLKMKWVLLYTYSGLSTVTLITRMVHLIVMNLSGKKYIIDGNSHFLHHKYPLPCTKVLGFVACRVISKFIGAGSIERSWGDVNTIKSGKRPAIRSDVSEKRSIIYTSGYIESAIIEQYHFDKTLNDHCSSYTWN